MYNEAARTMKDVDLTKVGFLYSVDWDSVSDERKQSIPDWEFYEDCLADQIFVDEHRLWAESEYIETDHEEIDMVLKELIKEADHYLVMAHNCRWNGASGYKIVGSRRETIYRNDDVCICPQKASKGGKTLICRESSHDVPMGARTSIIALTDKEYAMLENAEWDTVEKFADKCESRA